MIVLNNDRRRIQIFVCSLFLVFFLSGCESNQSGWLGTGITQEKIRLDLDSQSKSVVTVQSGKSDKIDFSATIALGASNENIVFSAVGLPSGVTAVFSPTSCKATISDSECRAQITISVGGTVLGGETPFSIVGKGDSSGKSATLAATLIVLPTLTISPKPTGGTITADVNGTDGTKINCGTGGTICLGSYTNATRVILTARPDTNFLFVSWNDGDCSGSAVTCPLTMNAAKAVSATFILKTFSLTVTAVGSGKVTSIPSGIDCGTDCDEVYPSGTIVTLTATPATTTATFLGWSDESCPGTAPCDITIDGTTTVKARFDVVFKAAVNMPVLAVGAKPNSIAIDDLNGDGKLDLVTASTGSNTVSIFAGDGTGVFSAAIDFPVGGVGPRSVVIGNFSGAGTRDLATANESNNTVSLLANDGNGLFSTTTVVSLLPGGNGPRSIAAGDLDSDGDLDIVTANLNTNNVSVLLGSRPGVFVRTDYPAGIATSSPFSAVIRDMNGDHNADIIVANFTNNTVSILLGNGDGTFNPATNFPVEPGGGPFSVAVFDVNNDGKIDILTANSANGINKVSLLLADSNGSFPTRKDFSVGTRPFFITMGDINGDGNLDIVTANFGSANVSVLLGDGEGNFQNRLNFPVGIEPRSVAIRDLNGDGKPDLVTANSGSGNVSVLINQ